MIPEETAERFADLGQIIEKLRQDGLDVPLEKWIDAAGTLAKAQELIDFFMTNHIISLDDKGVYRWYRSVHCGEKIIKNVLVRDNDDICV